MDEMFFKKLEENEMVRLEAESLQRQFEIETGGYSDFDLMYAKKQKEIKANAVKQEVKEIRFGPNTDEHDIDFKIKHSKHFLEQGHKVRAYVFFRGRTIIYKQRGIDLLMGYANVLIDEGYAKLESEPKEEGKKVAIILAPKVKK
jgi:translation initiation factor IF-3